MKRFISTLITVVMTAVTLCGALPAGASAESEKQYDTNASLGEDVSLKAENSFGKLLSDKLSEKITDQNEENGYGIVSAEVEDGTVNILYSALTDCTVVAALYDEGKVQLLASGSAEIFAEDSETSIMIADMPEYFYLKVFLIETDTMKPLCNVFESSKYTKEMQEFLSMTTDDFDSDKVLDLDGDKTNNFAVYSDSTVIIDTDGDSNKLVSADEENEIYVFENADEVLSGLKKGDIFSYDCGSGNIIIGCVGDIEAENGRVTLTGADTSMEDAFDYVKINTSMDMSDVIVEETDTEGVTYVEPEETEETNVNARVSGDVSLSAGVSVNLNIIGNDNVKLTGSASFSLGVELEIDITKQWQYFKLTLSRNLGYTISISGKHSFEVPIAKKMTFKPVFFGLKLEVEPKLVAEASAAFKYSGNIGSTRCFTVDSKADFAIDSNETREKYTESLKIEGTFFIGVKIGANLVFVSKKLAKAGFELSGGWEISGEMTPFNFDPDFDPDLDAKERHECRSCVEGEVSAKAEVSFAGSFLNSEKLSFSYNILGCTLKLFNFYYSKDRDKAGKGSCPYKDYLVTLFVKDPDGNPVEGAELKFEGYDDIYTSDVIGEINVWLAGGGKYYYYEVTYGELSDKYRITVVNDPVEYYVYLEPTKTEPSENPAENPSEPSGTGSGDTNDNKTDKKIIMANVGQKCCVVLTDEGDMYKCNCSPDQRHHYQPTKKMSGIRDINCSTGVKMAITKNNDLYIWGYNLYGQLTKSDIEESTEPLMVMKNVKKAVGYNTIGAITTDGSLYMWGSNECGELANGTNTGTWVPNPTPTKVLDNAKDVIIAKGTVGALTENGDLYIWGAYNSEDKYINDECYTPTKAMENVRSISFGPGDDILAITNNGELYTISRDPNKKIANRAKKLLDNVRSVSSSWYEIAAITESGELYRSKPILDEYKLQKIMDGVKDASLGYDNIAVITTDGDLYTWGFNIDGEYHSTGSLGNGTHEGYCDTPTKILSNVASVNMGSMSAITNDGKLYLWGGNSCHAGVENSCKPVLWDPIDNNLEYSEIEYLASENYFADETDREIDFEELIPNEIYNIYAMRSKEADEPFNDDNLLYITQETADENGRINLQYIMKEDYDGADIFAVPMYGNDISKLDIDCDMSEILFTGKGQKIEPEIYCGDKLLTPGADYYLEGDYIISAPGDYRLTVKGIGDYSGSYDISFSVYCLHEYETGICVICGAESETLVGDISGNGKIDIYDAIAVAEYLVGKRNFTDSEMKTADFNFDGKIDLYDAIEIAKFILI